MRLRYGSSYWLARPDARNAPIYPQHHGDIDVDSAIVGGGFTGCAAAYVLAGAGVRVALLHAPASAAAVPPPARLC